MHAGRCRLPAWHIAFVRVHFHWYFQHFDQGGLELNAAVCRNTWPVLSSRTEIPEFMKDLMEKGYMGVKSPSKRGFYDWNGVDMKAYAEKVSEPYWKFCNWDFLRQESE